jgi:F-type H+-transporting ATPase subunit alpha
VWYFSVYFSLFVSSLFNKGLRPAIDVGISVSRVGGDAQTKAMKSVAGTLKLELAQFRELEAFMQFAQDLDKATADRIASGQRMVEVLKQKNGEPLAMEKQAALLLAAQHKLFADVPVSRVREAAAALVSFYDSNYADTLATIKKIGKIEDDTKLALNKANEEFRVAHKELFE